MDSFGSSGSFLGQNDCTARSMVKALDNFLKSVHKMKDTIMVPSRLKDIKATLSDEDVAPSVYNDDLWSVVPSSRSKTSQDPQLCLSLFGAKNSTTGSSSLDIDLYSFYTMLRSIRNELVCGSPHVSSTNEKALKPASCCNKSRQSANLNSLDSQYGSMSEEEASSSSASSICSSFSSPDDTKDDDGNDERTDEHAEHLANIFRQHLTGLFVVLRQLTEAAHYCSQKYQDEIEGKK